MARLTKWVYKKHFIISLTEDLKYMVELDGSIHNSINTAKSHIDFLSK